MRSGLWGGLLLLVTVVGCAGDAPPFDDLPLRDTLRAEPDVVAALPEDARVRLAARFQVAAAGDTAADPVETAALVPAVLAAQADVARQRRSADALVIGLVGGGAAQALPAGAPTAATPGLPALEGVVATGTAAMEARALHGLAGGALRELFAASRAQRLERVVGWPVAAVAIGDTVYVNGAWLVAMAPTNADAGGGCDAGGCDGGAPASAMGQPPGRAGGASGAGGSGGRWMSPVGVGGTGGRPPPNPGTPVIAWPPSSYSYDAGTSAPPPTGSGTSTVDLNDTADAADSCASLADACASSDDGSDSGSCDSQDDGSGDSCSGSAADGSGDSCSAPADDGGGNCRTAPGRGRTRVPTVLWMFAPVAFLWRRRP